MQFMILKIDFPGMKKIPLKILIVFSMVVFGCASQNKFIFIPSPGSFNEIHRSTTIPIENIIESRGGLGNGHIPEWLAVYLNFGINAVENKDAFLGRYCFIEVVEGSNFDALNKWVNNFSPAIDFQKLLTARIERRIFASASLYPDDEYGLFYEKFIKRALNTAHPQAFLEDTYWVKINQTDGSGETYVFFVLISIERTALQAAITNMMQAVHAAVTPTRSQNNAIRRLQYNFFEGF